MIIHSAKAVLVVMLACMLLATGCGPNYGGNTYGSREARTAQTVERGTVVSVTNVQLQSDDPAILGTLAGGVVGGVLGNMLGGGRGRVLTTMAGAGAGAVAGNVAENSIRSAPGLEIEVQLDNGQSLSVVQGANEQFSPGDRVRILRGANGSARVQR